MDASGTSFRITTPIATKAVLLTYLVSSATQGGAYTVPKLFQKCMYLRGNGF